MQIKGGLVMKRAMVYSILVVLILFCSQLCFAQSSGELKALKDDVKALKEGQSTIQKDLQEIKKLLQPGQLPGQEPGQALKPLEPRNIVLNVKSDPFRGKKDAKLSIIEFSDYECPPCGYHVREVLPQMAKDYIKTGKVRYIVRDFPLESIHKNAFNAAEAARCAREQGKFWEMHERLFANQKALGLKDLTEHAKALGLDLPKFQHCLESEKYAKAIRKDMADGTKIGVKVTPTFLLGITEPKNTNIKVLRVLEGAAQYESFKGIIDSLLSSQK